MSINLETSRRARFLHATRRGLQFSAPLLISLLAGCALIGGGVDGESGFVGSTHDRDASTAVADSATQTVELDTGTGPLSPTVDAAVPLSDPPTPFELVEGGETFVGTVEMVCDGVGAPDSWRQRPLELQFALESDGADLTGRSWGLPVYGIGMVSGIASAAGATITLALHGSDYDAPEFVLNDVSLDAAGLRATIAAEIQARSGDIAFLCSVEGPYTFVRDTAPPIVEISTDAVGLSPISISFSEPVRSDVTIQILHEGTPVETAPVTAPSDVIASGLSLTPLEAWPGGELTLSITGLTDVAGNVGDITRSIEVPATYTSATLDPGFEEAEEGTLGPWYTKNCDVKTSEVDMRGIYPPILPEEGAQFLVCRFNGRVLQAYIEPPPGATRLLLDVGSTSDSGGLNDVVPLVTLTLMSGKEAVTLQAIDPTPDTAPTQLQPFGGELMGNGAPVWLLVDYTGWVYPTPGLPYGSLLVDNLRFE